MKDYNLSEAFQIVQSQTTQTLKIIPHLQQREIERDFNINYLLDCILNQIPLSISKTYYNRFKLIYPHENKNSLDLYVIIKINNNKEISIISAYPKNKNRREKEYGK